MDTSQIRVLVNTKLKYFKTSAKNNCFSNIFTSHHFIMTNIFFEPVQVLLFRDDQPHIQYYDNIILQASTESNSNNNKDTYPSPAISDGSRRNSLFSSHSSNHSFNYDSTDDSLTYPQHNNNNINNGKISLSQKSSTLDLHKNLITPINNNSTSSVSITKLRSSKKVKDKALLFEKLIQNESKQYSSSPHSYSSQITPNHIHNASFSFNDDIDTINNNNNNNNNPSKTKYISQTYMNQLERSKSPINTTPTRRIVSTKLSEYENHINNLNHIDNNK
ncbi:hypothetical protein MOUN0_L05864 [Monosporozyma unispora]|nr:hypothetical protein C6P44_004930 [Kazachstania unispora]